VWTASLQGAQNFRCVRVTDGTDTAASASLGLSGTPTVAAGGTGNAANDVLTLSNGAVLKVTTVSAGAVTAVSVTSQPTSQPANPVSVVSTTGSGTGATFDFTYAEGATLTSRWTGSGANGSTASLSSGSLVGSWKLVLFHSGNPTETFDNIGAGLSGTALWAAVAAAVNGGNAVRGPSQLMVASAGTSAAAPAAAQSVLAGGTDGATGVATTSLVGVDASPRTGLYALRNQGCSVGMISDLTDSTSWPDQAAFGLSEGVYMIGATAMGDTVAGATARLASAGVDAYAFKLMFGDWCYFLDTINGVTRLVSPQGFVAGWIAAWGPQFSSLNKPLLGIVGTQKSQSNTRYMDDELEALENGRIDVIANPAPGGPYFACRIGCNTASSAAVNGDNYTRMTNFIAETLNQGLGQFIGELQTPTEQAEALATLNAFFSDLWSQGAIGSSNPSQIPWAVSIANNQSEVAAGQQIANAAVIYLSVIQEFVVNVEGGQTVAIPTASPRPLAA
ncbi:MAG: hypothetical protein ACREEQ_12890, partial [Caulobacteraceae bacterium]